MAETITVGGIEVLINQSRRARRLILRATPSGVRVTKPLGVSYRSAASFARKQQGWIAKNYKPALQPKDGDLIGRGHRLSIVSGESLEYKILDNEIIVRRPDRAEAKEVSDTVATACIEALRGESKRLIKQRLPFWQDSMALKPAKVTIRHSVSRWGSCSSKKNLNFSLFIAQLEPELLDYIFVHELSHIRHKNHQAEFWALVGEHIPDYYRLRQELKKKSLAVEPKPGQ